MKFGKVNDLSGIQFEPPQLEWEDLSFLRQSAQTGEYKEFSTLQFYFGETGWGNPEWKGTLYPPKAAAKDFLRYYGDQFNSIELNTTHYRIPTSAMVRKWKETVPVDFKFAVKFVQLVSHRRDWGRSTGAFVEFIEALQQFEQSLGLAFIQLPTYSKFRDLPAIIQLVQLLDTSIPTGIELRDPSFYDGQVISEVKDLFRSKNISWVITDTAGVRDIVKIPICSARLMVRFVGCGDAFIDKQRLLHWIERIQQMEENGLEEVFFYLHEPDHYDPGFLSLYLWEAIRQQGKWTSRGPTLLASPPQQTKLFE